jgi:hypothetical protein
VKSVQVLPFIEGVRDSHGNPDGIGDLKANHQIALRAEVVYGWAFMDLDAFAVVKDAVANS